MTFLGHYGSTAVLAHKEKLFDDTRTCFMNLQSSNVDIGDIFNPDKLKFSMTTMVLFKSLLLSTNIKMEHNSRFEIKQIFTMGLTLRSKKTMFLHP